jgi:hypothetical protein
MRNAILPIPCPLIVTVSSSLFPRSPLLCAGCEAFFSATDSVLSDGASQSVAESTAQHRRRDASGTEQDGRQHDNE